MFGLGVHIDPVRSTRRTRLLTFGHVWVVLSVLFPVPFSERVWALPVLFRLYRTQADCQCCRARLLMEIWTGWLMGIDEDERAWSRLVDGHQRG